MTSQPSVQLRRQHELFVAAYIKLHKAGEAAVEAGYSKRTAYSIGSELLKRPDIKAEIERRTEALLDRYEISARNITRELASMAFVNVEDFVAKQDDGSVIVDFSTATKRQMAGLSSIQVEEYVEGRGKNAARVKSVKFKLGDKRQALMDLAKLARMLPADRHEHTGADGGPIQVQAEHKVDIKQLSHEQRDQLRTLLLATRKRDSVTDVEDES